MPVDKESAPATLLAELTGAFTISDVSFRPGYRSGDKFRVFPYIKKEVIMQRLDAVLGNWNWRCKYDSLMDGTVCTLALRLDGEWIEKQGVGAERAMDNKADSIKAGATDAFRQAAEAWGFNRMIEGLPALMWEAETTGTGDKAKFKTWKEANKMRARFKELLDKRATFHRDDVIGDTHTESSTGETERKQPASTKPQPKMVKPEKGITSSSAELLANGLKTNLKALAEAKSVDLDLLAASEFMCGFADLNQQAGAYLHAGLQDGWIEQKLQPMPAPMWETRGVLEGVQRAGFDLFALGKVARDGKHYKVGGGAKPATVWQADGVTQCDCTAKRETQDAPKCSHIHAVMFWAQAQPKPEQAASSSTAQPAKAAKQ